jgi:hypothetical protein
MGRTAITPTDVDKLKSYVDTAGTTPVSTSIATLVADGAKVAGNADSRLLFRVVNTYAGAKVITIKGKDGDDDEDMEISLTQDEVQIFTLEDARFEYVEDDDYPGYICIDFATAMTGTIEVYKIPK